MKKKKPSTAFLVILNGLLFFGAGAIGSTIFGIYMMVFATAGFMVSSALWHIVVVLAEKKISLNPLLRAAAFTLPFWLLLILPLVGIKPERPENKQRPAISLNGTYEAKVGTSDGIWVLEIEEQATGESYTEQTDFVAHLNVYWIWDDSDNFWLYNSDDSGVHVWTLEDETWKHHEWGWGGERKNKKLTIDPPLALLPDYAKSRHQTSEPVGTGQPM